VPTKRCGIMTRTIQGRALRMLMVLLFRIFLHLRLLLLISIALVAFESQRRGERKYESRDAVRADMRPLLGHGIHPRPLVSWRSSDTPPLTPWHPDVRLGRQPFGAYRQWRGYAASVANFSGNVDVVDKDSRNFGLERAWECGFRTDSCRTARPLTS
jgi:hypothetical protein